MPGLARRTGYPPQTPAIIVARVSWPDETVITTMVRGLADALTGSEIRTAALVLVGPALSGAGTRSQLYDSTYSHGCRRRSVTTPRRSTLRRGGAIDTARGGSIVTVHLVGAGPGDPQLLTRRGAALLAGAEHVVYDRPSMAEIVALAPTATRHCVGKQGATPAQPQHQINALLIELGRTGACVVRLKSGDPFVVSHGGEEAMALTAAGVGVDVVPGVSAAVAAPAAAGIPVMVRHISRTLTVVAGNENPDEVDWAAIARLGGTVVVVTGRAELCRMIAALRAGGMPGHTPVAAISAATLPNQHTVRGTLDEPPDPWLATPLTVVIGDVARLDVATHLVQVAP